MSGATKKLCAPFTIEEVASKEGLSAVTMQDDFGELLRVEVSPIPEDINSYLSEEFKDPQQRLKIIFLKLIKPFMAEFKPQIIYEELFDMEGVGPAYYVALDLKEGSSYVCSETKKRKDTMRSFLLTFDENYLVVLSTQPSALTLDLREFFGDQDKLELNLLEELKEIRETYKNERY